MNAIAKLKEMVSMEEVYERYTGKQLNEYGRGVCPLHLGENEQTFSVKDNMFKCFSCNKSGDIVNFLMMLNNSLTVSECIRKLQDDFNRHLPRGEVIMGNWKQDENIVAYNNWVRVEKQAFRNMSFDYRKLLDYIDMHDEDLRELNHDKFAEAVEFMAILNTWSDVLLEKNNTNANNYKMSRQYRLVKAVATAGLRYDMMVLYPMWLIGNTEYVEIARGIGI